MSQVQIAQAPEQFAAAIAAGFTQDDDGLDVRATGNISHYDNTGGDSEDTSGFVYRLWNADASAGVVITVYESGRVEECRIDSDGCPA